MKEMIGKNIAKYRKAKNMTQAELSEKMHISFQAISKWENEQSSPDIATLITLADILNVSMDDLVGCHHISKFDFYDKQYNTDNYYWGTAPSSMCLRIIDLCPPVRPLKLLDVGCGEGKDAVFMARCGYTVTAFDIAKNGIEKTKLLAESAGVYVDAFVGDINTFRLEEDYDIIYSSGVFQYIKPELRSEIVENYKCHTNFNGLNAFHVFVDKPFIAPPPDDEEDTFNWRSGEILSEYADWLTEDFSEYIFDCNSSGVPHKHAANVIYSRKVCKLG